jgi:hypothetical protein
MGASLVSAVKAQDGPQVKKILQSSGGSLDLNEQDADGRTILHKACRLGNEEVDPSVLFSHGDLIFFLK